MKKLAYCNCTVLLSFKDVIELRIFVNRRIDDSFSHDATVVVIPIPPPNRSQKQFPLLSLSDESSVMAVRLGSDEAT